MKGEPATSMDPAFGAGDSPPDRDEADIQLNDAGPDRDDPDIQLNGPAVV